MAVSFILAMMSFAAESRAVDQMVPLVSRVDTPGEYCTVAADWCVSLPDAQDADDDLVHPVVRAGSAVRPTPRPPAEAWSNENYAIWPSLILLKDGGFLAGVEARTSTAYSGGGGSATELRLFRISPAGEAAAKPALNVPVGASLLIRACFSETDMRRRRGACHDEYSFSATLSLAGETTAELPALAYVTAARAFPRGVSRLADSTQSRLKKSDLVQEPDPACSFSRRFRFDAVAGAYQPDSPLPDCSAYTVP